MHWYLDGSRRRAGRGNNIRDSYLSEVKVKAPVNERSLFAQP